MEDSDRIKMLRDVLDGLLMVVVAQGFLVNRIGQELEELLDDDAKARLRKQVRETSRRTDLARESLILKYGSLIDR